MEVGVAQTSRGSLRSSLMRPTVLSKRDTSWTSCANASLGGSQLLRRRTFQRIPPMAMFRRAERTAFYARRCSWAISSNAVCSAKISCGGTS